MTQAPLTPTEPEFLQASGIFCYAPTLFSEQPHSVLSVFAREIITNAFSFQYIMYQFLREDKNHRFSPPGFQTLTRATQTNDTGDRMRPEQPKHVTPMFPNNSTVHSTEILPFASVIFRVRKNFETSTFSFAISNFIRSRLSQMTFPRIPKQTKILSCEEFFSPCVTRPSSSPQSRLDCRLCPIFVLVVSCSAECHRFSPPGSLKISSKHDFNKLHQQQRRIDLSFTRQGNCNGRRSRFIYRIVLSCHSLRAKKPFHGWLVRKRQEFQSSSKPNLGSVGIASHTNFLAVVIPSLGVRGNHERHYP